MTEQEVPQPRMMDVAYANRELERKYEGRFHKCFGIRLHKFMDIITGFDSIKFDKEFIGAFDLDGVSLKDLVEARYGDEGVAILKGLLCMPETGEIDGLSVLARGPVDIYANCKPKFNHDGLLKLLPEKYPQLEISGAAWLVNLWELEARAMTFEMPRTVKAVDQRISTTKRRIESNEQRKIKNRADFFAMAKTRGRNFEQPPQKDGAE